jgi:hypothetical protein
MALREAREHSSLLRGLLYFGVIAVVFSVARASLHRAFVPHWWQQW